MAGVPGVGARPPRVGEDACFSACMARLLVRSRTMKRTLTSCLLLLACARGPGAAETLPKLKAAIESEVSSPEQNIEHSRLAQQVSEAKHLHGLTRAELEQQLGAGDPCQRHPICAERGFDSQDRYYEIGRAGNVYVRYRPALIVGFNQFGKVEKTFVLRAQE